MIYVMISRGNGFGELSEMSKAELEERWNKGLSGNIVSANYARKWVKHGGHHSTPLWVDMDGKVRYARENS